MTTPTTPPVAVQMPPLPVAVISLCGKKGRTLSESVDYFTADQMHAYAQAYAAEQVAELEKRVKALADALTCVQKLFETNATYVGNVASFTFEPTPGAIVNIVELRRYVQAALNQTPKEHQ